MTSMACMLGSAALFNRHRNADFLSLVSKFRRRCRDRKLLQARNANLDKNDKLTSAEPAGAASKSSTDVGATKDGSAVNDNVAETQHPVSVESAPSDTMTGLHTGVAQRKVLHTICVFHIRFCCGWNLCVTPT